MKIPLLMTYQTNIVVSLGLHLGAVGEDAKNSNDRKTIGLFIGLHDSEELGTSLDVKDSTGSVNLKGLLHINTKLYLWLGGNRASRCWALLVQR